MANIKISDLVSSISQLGTAQSYTYYSGTTHLRIVEVTRPEGPIRIKRWNCQGEETLATEASISTNQLATVAAVFSRKPNHPIQFDKLFSGGGNSRSALETLLAHTPNFFICYPQRANPYTGKTDNGIKHIMWCPEESHPSGQIGTKDYNLVISEFEFGIDLGDVQIAQSMLGDEFDSIEAKKIHTQMQVALVKIGNAMNFHTWIAKNDHSIPVENRTLGSLEGVISTLDQVPILYDTESKRSASLIDCIWFSSDFRYIPAVIEIEHSTGVTSGMTRMLKFRQTIPSISMTYAIVASLDLRSKVISEANNNAFRELQARFMPYSTVRELYGLVQRYKLTNVVERTFIEPFMEKVVE
ncbi:MAG: restriction endonuclease [Sedimentisphaerales bacterium]|jgi:type II restriction enzyme